MEQNYLCISSDNYSGTNIFRTRQIKTLFLCGILNIKDHKTNKGGSQAIKR